MKFDKRKKGKGRGKGCRALVCALLLSGCASLSEEALPRASNALDGLKSFYQAFCEPVPDGKEEECKDGRKAVNTVGEFYNDVSEVFGEDE